ncbi:hypothetical protein [Demequina silvatica]|uniref:hypothetical protein n=1 Tax=Demequina silvatica TaxID=1638988 RepID=UPI000785B011|nr:hypothetical protein [Demequina silvatica]
MSQNTRQALIEDIIEGLAHGDVADGLPAFAIVRTSDGSGIKVDLGEPDRVYIVSVAEAPRVD